jgi:GTP-binding protein
MKVFIIGQSNVGKSYLFNQLCRKNIAITQNEENTTIDTISCKMGDTILIDTPGLKNTSIPYEADLFLYKVRDSGLEEFDNAVLKNIYKTGIPLILVAKRLEGLPSGEKYSDIEELQQRLNLREYTRSPKPMVIIIGKENSGKSTLMNTILGYERCKVSEKAGTTKDSIVEESSEFCFVDTAGYCNEKTYMQKLISEKRKEVLKDCDGVILLLDGSKPITRMEKQLIQECKIYSNFCVAAINKSDILDQESKLTFEYFHFANFPVVNISAKNKQIRPLLSTLRKIYRNSTRSISTSKINSWFSDNRFELLDSNNKPIKIKYLFQSSIRAMQFKYFSLKKMNGNSEKFLLSQISKAFRLEGVNLRITFNKK